MRRTVPFLLSLLVVAMCTQVLSCGGGDDDQEPRLKRVRLFSIDSDIDSIHELNPRNGKVITTFLAPGPGITGGACGLAYDSVTNRLFFHDSNMGPEFWVINPDSPDPTGTAIALPTTAQKPLYDGLAHDGTFLLALDPSADQIDFISPSSGDFIKSETYTEDLSAGIDCTKSRLFSGGQDTGGTWVVNELDFQGNLIVQLYTGIPGFQPQGLGLARGLLFVSDIGNLEIWIFDLDTGDAIGNIRIQGATSVCGLAAGKK